jgi:hypothetical protein
MSKNNLDRPFTCVHFFADGRRCQMPPSADDMGLCYFHAKKFQNRLNSQEAGRQISQFLETDILTACDLSSTFASLFSATAQGRIKPKTAATLTYLGRLMLQTQKLAKKEFLESFDDRWPKIVEEAPAFNPLEPEPTPAPATTQPTETALITQNESPTDDPTADPNADPADTAPHPIPFPKIM